MATAISSVARSRVDNFLRRAREEGHGQVAKNFIRSMLMLTAAMVAALYANSAARDGRVFAAATGALVAMSIAIWVAFRFVPPLAAGVDWGWLPFFTRYQVTREGWIFIAASGVVTLAAINTNNNLLYMVLAALLAVMVLSGVLSAMNFRGIDLEVRMPDTCFAGESFSVTITMGNRKRVFPTFSLEVGPGGIHPGQDAPVPFASYYVPIVPAASHSSRTTTALVPVRGLFEFRAVRLQSRYPFGFLVKGRDIRVAGEVLAFPAILPPEGLGSSVRDTLGSSERFERGQGMDLYMIREYQSTDSARHVDWKASAKTSRLKTREFATEESRRVVLAFDRYGRPGQSEAFERLVSEAASTVVHLVANGVEVTLVSDEWISNTARTGPQAEAILRYLALVERAPAAPPPDTDAGREALRFSLRSPRHAPETATG